MSKLPDGWTHEVNTPPGCKPIDGYDGEGYEVNIHDDGECHAVAPVATLHAVLSYHLGRDTGDIVEVFDHYCAGRVSFARLASAVDRLRVKP